MDLIGDPFRPLQPYFFAAAFALARMIAMMIVFPVFDRLGVTGLIRNSIALVLSIPLIPMIAAHLEQRTVQPRADRRSATEGGRRRPHRGPRIGRAAVCSGGGRRRTRPATRVLVGHPQRPSRNDANPNITGTLLALVIIALYFASGCFDLTLRADLRQLWHLAGSPHPAPAQSRSRGSASQSARYHYRRPASCW